MNNRKEVLGKPKTGKEAMVDPPYYIAFIGFRFVCIPHILPVD